MGYGVIVRDLILFALLLGYGAAECKFEMPDGQTVDLKEMRLESPPDYRVFGLSGFLYVANICGEAFLTCNGDATGVASQWIGFNNCISVLGRQNSGKGESFKPIADYIDPKNKKKGVVLTYYNGDICFSLGFLERKVIYELECDESVDVELKDVIEDPTCVYTFKFKTKRVCSIQVSPPIPSYTSPNESSTIPSPPPKSSKTKTFLIILLISILLYYLFRSLMKRYSSDSIPLSSKPESSSSFYTSIHTGIWNTVTTFRRLFETYILRTRASNYSDLN
jgi:hypothetical protein